MMKARGKVVWALLLALCLVPMLLFAFLGFSSRPMSDDFCHFAITPSLSIRDNLLYWRNGGDNGSYSNLAMNSLLTPFGLSVARAFPALLIGLWFVSTAALLSGLMGRFGLIRHRLVIALALAALLVAAISDSTSTPAALYWYTASLKYTAPMLVLTLYLVLLLHVVKHAQGRAAFWLTTIAGAALCFFAAGFAETLTMPMLLGLTLLYLVLWRAGGRWRERCLPIVGAGWIGAVVSMLVMITAPGLSARVETATSSRIVANRTFGDVLSLAANAWLDHMTDPAAFASFILLLVAGLLAALVYARPAKISVSSPGRVARNPFLFGLAVQLLLLPMLWSHQSDYPSILGRFSGGYFVVIVLNAGLLLSLALLLWRRKQADAWLENHGHVLPLALLAVILLCFALTQFRSIHWRANTYLWASAHSLLAVLAWQLSSHLPSSMARRFAVGMGCLYITTWLGAAGVAMAVNSCCKEDILRTYTFLAHLIAWSGLAWGVYLGWALKASAQKNRLLKTGALAVALWLGCAMVGDNLALLPNFQTYADAFDARHTHIVTQREAGIRSFSFAPLPYDLPRKLSVAPFDTHHCPLLYYDIDKIEIEAQQ